MKYLRLLLTLLVLLLPVTTVRATSDDLPTEIPLGNIGSSGDYEITFTLLDECVYSGLFEIE